MTGKPKANDQLNKAAMALYSVSLISDYLGGWMNYRYSKNDTKEELEAKLGKVTGHVEEEFAQEALKRELWLLTARLEQATSEYDLVENQLVAMSAIPSEYQDTETWHINKALLDARHDTVISLVDTNKKRIAEILDLLKKAEIEKLSAPLREELVELVEQEKVNDAMALETAKALADEAKDYPADP